MSLVRGRQPQLGASFDTTAVYPQQPQPQQFQQPAQQPQPQQSAPLEGDLRRENLALKNELLTVRETMEKKYSENMLKLSNRIVELEFKLMNAGIKVENPTISRRQPPPNYVPDDDEIPPAGPAPKAPADAFKYAPSRDN